MIETGALTENDRVELLEGLIVDKMPQHPVHAGTISVLHGKLLAKLPKGWIIRIQSPVTLEDSEPEPDLAVVRGPEERYLGAHPTAEDIAILIEVADTSLDSDRSIKGGAYARAGIPYYWIVNLIETKVEVYSQPQPKKSAYRHREDNTVELGVSIVIGGRDRGGIPVAHLFP